MNVCHLLVGALLALGSARAVHAQDDFRPIRVGDPPELGSIPIYPGASYDESIPHPDATLGQPLGSRAAHHHEVFAYFRALAAGSPRVSFHSIGRTYEGRELGYAVITAPANHARIDEIRADVAKLHDPRGVGSPELDAILYRTPAIAWMAYSIHGDETSGSDGALAFAHHLAASTAAATTSLLENVVIVIDPMMNPDGRERILSLVEQSAGYTPALNANGMQRGRWPYGRGNHYLFDMNRDWLPGACPETRARWTALRDFHPQLFVDAHEMGSLDTFLFSPPREPIQQYSLIASTAWPQRFSRDQAAAFDERGWSYYTREWFEGWGPFYSDSWAQLAGAVGILYEQARFAGQSIQRRSGERVTYREAVAHQAVSSLANVRTLAANREAVLTSFLQIARANLRAETPGNDRMFVVIPGRNFDREDRLVRTLVAQGIECRRSDGEFDGRASVSTLDRAPRDRRFPAGAIVVSPRQPMGSRAKAFLEFDPRLSPEVLATERRELEHENESGVYDVTAWSLPLAFDVDAYWCAHADVTGELVRALPAAATGLVPASDASAPVYGWAVDGAADAAVAFAVRALESGLAVRLADEPFTSGGSAYPRGSLLVRDHENPDVDAAALVQAAAATCGVAAHALTTGRAADDGPDLGGGHFTLLERPRVGLVGNAPIRSDAYGHLWHLLDVELGQRVTLVDAQALERTDLRQFNVLILPPGASRATLEPLDRELEAWVRSGGTLIAIASSAAALCDPENGLSSVRLLRDVLEEREPYRWAAWRERRALAPTVDLERVWGDPRAPAEDSEEQPDAPTSGRLLADASAPSAEQQDAWMRRFSPQGVFLRGGVDPAAWITVGAEGELPVFFRGDRVFLSKDPVQTPVRLAVAENLRLSGLVWPEAAERIAESAFLTVESLGHGQLILFATTPGFRGLYRATGRLFANAVVYGPGAGAHPPLGW